MVIKHIRVKNFRGYEQRDFIFDNHLSVIVGNNTAGKTALLQAIQVALGAYLASLRDLPNEPAYRHNFTKEDVYMRYDPDYKDFFKSDEKTRIDVDALFPRTVIREGKIDCIIDDNISWWREMRGSRTTHSQECAGELINRVEEMVSMRKNKTAPAIYPLVLSFGVNRIDNQYKSAAKTEIRASKIVKAYMSSLRETVDFKSAFDWLYRHGQPGMQDREFEGTYTAFIEALTTAIPALSDVFVDSKNRELIAKLSVYGQEPNYQIFDHMSDGFKSIICMVAEMAYRCVQLNGFLGKETIKKTPGVVLIDELDLYLHPHWQVHLLKDLHEAFPLIQFIVTSHSPFIIQSVRTQNLIVLDGRYDETDPILRSIEEISLSEMNMETRRSKAYLEMLEKAEKYYQLVKHSKEDTAEAIQISKELDDIEQEFSSDPAYVALLKAERNSL